MAFHMDEFGAPKFRRLGVDVLVVESAGEKRLESQERIWRLHADSRAWDGIRESVPGMNNLTLLYDERKVSPADLEHRVRTAWNVPGEGTARAARLHLLAVRYGGGDGPDLPAVADALALSEREVVALHAGCEYIVYFLGFQPGFAYLGDLDERLRLPRRDTPRAAVPAGSVAIALHHTSVYPFASPGGWHIIGSTDVPVFDPTAGKALFAPGDRVRFKPA